jgi:hypothetical protein
MQKKASYNHLQQKQGDNKKMSVTIRITLFYNNVVCCQYFPNIYFCKNALF